MTHFYMLEVSQTCFTSNTRSFVSSSLTGGESKAFKPCVRVKSLKEVKRLQETGTRPVVYDMALRINHEPDD